MNIIDFDLKVKEQKHGVKKKVLNTCQHNKMLADEHLQVLECEECGKIISAWDYVLELCKKEQRIFENIKYAKMEGAQLSETLTDLKRQIRNAKSQLNRAIK